MPYRFRRSSQPQNRGFSFIWLTAAIWFVLTALLTSSLHAATFTVDTTTDDVAKTACDDATSDDCSLRGAITKANGLAEASTINVPAGTYVLSQLSSCTYRFRISSSSVSSPVTTSQIFLCLSKQVTLEGAGSASTIIDANQTGPVLYVGADGIVELRGVTLQHGIGDINGGGIKNHGALTLTESVVSNNTLPASSGGAVGAGIYNGGSLTLLRSTVSDNGLRNEGGGGIYNDGSLQGVATVIDSTIRNNTIGRLGGGIMNVRGVMTVTGSTITGNTATLSSGGGIYNDGALTMTNSTISGNFSGSSGGGITNSQHGSTDLNNVTITGNTSGTAGIGQGGGIDNALGLSFSMRNTIVAGNTDLAGTPPKPDCDARTSFGAVLTSRGHNLIGNVSGCAIIGDTSTNIIGQDPKLGPLANYGGLTKTHALLPGSPAINAADPSLPGGGGTACAATDQRGFLRPEGTTCDIGAFEAKGGFAVASLTPSRGGNTGTVTMAVFGSGFVDGATIKLTRSGVSTTIIGKPVVVTPGGVAISGVFDLTGLAPGLWDVVVTNPDQTTATLPGAFTVEQGGASQVWVSLVSPHQLRAGHPLRFLVFFGNHGNEDAFGVPLSFAFLNDLTFRLQFPIAAPPPQSGQVLIDWSKVPIDVATGGPENTSNFLFLLPVVPAGFTGALEFMLTAPVAALGQSFAVRAQLDFPYFRPELNPSILQDHIDGARAFAQANFGVTIPPEREPELRQYATTQFQEVVENGVSEVLASAGARLPVYSRTQLLIDLALFGSHLSTAQAQTNLQPLAVSSQNAGVLSSQSLRQPAARWWGAKEVNDASWLPVVAHFTREAVRYFPDVMDFFLGGADANAQLLCEGCSSAPTCAQTGGELRTCLGKSVPGGTQVLGIYCCPKGSGEKCCPKDPGGSGLGPLVVAPAPIIVTLPTVGSGDPNTKAGVRGAGEGQFLAGENILQYGIFFENLSTASAAAQEVVITDQLDNSKVDFDTFSLGPISFGDKTVTPPPGLSQYDTSVDLRPAQNIVVGIDARIDKSTGIVTWRFTSIDPLTGQFTDDPLAGFLPPNVNPPEGDGSVVFTIQPKVTDVPICNQARIVFDVNDPIDTPQWCNTIDRTPPTSKVSALAATQAVTSFPVQWSGMDDGAGIGDYTLFVSVNGGPYNAVVSNTPDTATVFTGEVGKQYAFYTVARDLVGNEEAPPAVADATTQVMETDQCPNDPNKTAPGACGCDVADTDSDGDGTPDCLDGCSTDAAKTTPGLCGCGIPDTDSDGDGSPNCQDQCPSDASKTQPGACGCGTPESVVGQACTTGQLGVCSAGTKVCTGGAVSCQPNQQPSSDAVCPSTGSTLFLHATGTTLFLNATAPTVTSAQFKDSAGVNFSNGNPWKEVGVWTATEGQVNTLSAVGNLRLWLGLKNSDDQGTQFDVKAEVRKGVEIIATGEARCVTGVTRNPQKAKEVAVSFAAFSPVSFGAEQLSLRLSTRIGTKADGSKCSGPGGSHNSAQGVRVYFDAVTRPAGFPVTP